MPPKTKSCAVCRKRFAANRRSLTCSDRCRYERWKAQMAAINGKRTVGPLSPIPCAICGTEFTPKRAGHKYHSPECASVGLARAVEAQQRRRRKKIPIK